MRFIEAILNETLDLRRKKRAVLVKELEDKGFDKLETPPSFDYLLKMNFWNLTEEDVEELKRKAEEAKK